MNYVITRSKDSDELMHYGVLGMKWGQRRARKYAEKANRMRISANELKDIADYQKSKGKTKTASKKYKKIGMERARADKYDAKAKAIQDKHTKRAGGKKAYDYTAKQSTGKTLAKSYLMGTYGTLRYNEARSKGASRGKAAVDGILYAAANNATLGAMSIIEPRLRE